MPTGADATNASTQSQPHPSIAPAIEDALAAIQRLKQALKLYGADHDAASAAARNAAEAISKALSLEPPGWIRVLPDRFVDALGAHTTDRSLRELATGLCAANVAAIGLFAPLTAAAAKDVARCLVALVSRSTSIHAAIEELERAAGGAFRIRPVSTGQFAFAAATSDGQGGPVDWQHTLDQVLDKVDAQLDSLSDSLTTSVGEQTDSMDSVLVNDPVEKLAHVARSVPPEQRAPVIEQLRGFFSRMPQDRRRGLLHLEPGRPHAHFDAVCALAEALPSADVAAAIDAAAEKTGTVSPHTLRILSKLIGLSRDDTLRQQEVRDVLKRCRDRAAGSPHADPSVRVALETLLQGSNNRDFNPQAYEETLGALIEQDATHVQQVSIEWEPTAAQACIVAAAIAAMPDHEPADRPGHRRLVARRLTTLIAESGFDHIADALADAEADGGDAAHDLLRAATDPGTLRAVAEATLLPGIAPQSADRLMRSLGPKVGARLLNEAGREARPDVRARFVGMARAAGDWSDLIRRAAAVSREALTEVFTRQPGLTRAESDSLSTLLISLGDEETSRKVMEAIRTSGDHWSETAINHGLASGDPALQSEAIRRTAAQRQVQCLPRLAEYLCGDTAVRFRPFTSICAANAMASFDELGIQALVSVARTLAGRRGAAASLRLFFLGRVLWRHRLTDPIRLLTADPACRAVRSAVRAWHILNLIPGVVP